ncbi:MAG: hypothetical protein IPK26_13630 [Planctomycetes bacterium]|nr:hypothetical protein [Planctomycetota bacterium]
MAVLHAKEDDVTDGAGAGAQQSPESSGGRSTVGRRTSCSLVPSGEPENHLQCLRWISTLARSAYFRRFFLDARDEAALRELLREMTPKT